MKLSNSQTQAPTLLLELEEDLALMVGRSQFAIKALDRVQLWAGSSPYLIELLSQHLTQCLQLADSEVEAQTIDDFVQQTIIEDWQHNTAAAHFCEIELTLLSYSRVDSLLILYLKVLQRGETAAENGSEQALLLASGLVVQDGSRLRIANAIYRSVFDLDWLEQKVPGLTKPVSIVRLDALPLEGSHCLEPVSVLEPVENIFAGRKWSRQSAYKTKLYSKAMVLAGCMAAIVGGLVTYVQGSGPRSLTADSSMMKSELVQDGAIDFPTERELFDAGTEQATNGRWLMMMREFCSIPEESAYFELAKRSMEKWIVLYEEDIGAAKAAFANEGNPACAVMP